MAEPNLPSVYRGKQRNTPQEHIRFEYRIDRKHRVLRREDMFPNPFHPSGLDMMEEFFVCNSIHSHNLRVGLEGLAPGASFTFPDYPNEHLLLHLGGEITWHVAGENFEPTPGDQIFTPAFLPYTITNTGDRQAWLVSGYARVDEWLGRDPRETRIAPGCETHRFLPCMNGPFAREGSGWQEWTGLDASRNRSRTMRVASGAKIAAQHLQAEQIVITLSGTGSWRVDGQEILLEAEDFLYIPAMVPFSVQNAAAEVLLLVIYDVSLQGV